MQVSRILMARKSRILFLCVFILWISKLSEAATVNVTHHLWCTCDLPLQPTTSTITGEFRILIVKHKDVNVFSYNNSNGHLTMDMGDHSFAVNVPEEQAKHDHKQKAEAAVKYRKGWFKVYNSSDDEDLRGLYTCLRLCITSGNGSVKYTISDAKILMIGWPSSGHFSSPRDGFECKITQRIVLLCNTGYGCNTTMEVFPPSSCQVGPCDSDGKHSQPSWHCEGDKHPAAKQQKTCYLNFWYSKLDCCVKYRCTESRRDNTTNIFDCSWDQDDSPGGGRCKNSVPAVTVTRNNREQSDSTETFNTPAVYHNDSITDNMNNPEQSKSNIAVIVITVVFSIIVLIAVLLCICVMYVFYHIDEYVSHLDMYHCCPQPQSALAGAMPTDDPAAPCLILSYNEEETKTSTRPDEHMEKEPGCAELENVAVEHTTESIAVRIKTGQRMKEQPATVQNDDRGRYYDQM